MMTGETVKKCPFKEGEVRFFTVFYRNIQFFRKGFGPLRRSGLSLIFYRFLSPELSWKGMRKVKTSKLQWFKYFSQTSFI